VLEQWSLVFGPQFSFLSAAVDFAHGLFKFRAFLLFLEPLVKHPGDGLVDFRVVLLDCVRLLGGRGLKNLFLLSERLSNHVGVRSNALIM